jgi:hypothetical protein
MRTGLKFNCLVLAVCLLIPQAKALILSGTGPANDAGWPKGAATVANLKSSVGWWEGPPFGGGEWHVLFRSNTEAFVQALTNFAAIRAPALDLVIHDGPKHDPFLKREGKPDTDTRVDWEFVVWHPESWNRLYNNTNQTIFTNSPNFRKPAPAPRLDVYVGGGGVDWAKTTIPSGLHIRDERARPKSSERTP